MKVLFTSSGRRVELIRLFAENDYTTFSADCDETAPTLKAAQKGFIVPKVTCDPNAYIASLLDIVQKEGIDLIIPLIDPELVLFSQKKDAFRKAGAMVLISEPSSVQIASDKLETYAFFQKSDLNPPETFPIRGTASADIPETLFPILLKPRKGSAGQGIFLCKNQPHFLHLLEDESPRDYIGQKKVGGEEITMDIFGDGGGNIWSAVQRKRLKIRGGEVERGITVKYPVLFEDAERFCRMFKPFGPVNIQCFFSEESNERHYTEINPRFGGGYPLAYRAGANFPVLIRRLIDNSPPPDDFRSYRENILMSRYDSAVYFPHQTIPSE